MKHVAYFPNPVPLCVALSMYLHGAQLQAAECGEHTGSEDIGDIGGIQFHVAHPPVELEVGLGYACGREVRELARDYVGRIKGWQLAGLDFVLSSSENGIAEVWVVPEVADALPNPGGDDQSLVLVIDLEEMSVLRELAFQ